MSTQLITNYFRLHNVNQFRESISETANSTYYIFAGRHLEYPDGDGVVPSITKSVDETTYTAYQEMVFGKRVTASDVCAVVPRYNWTSNTRYAAYRSNEDLTDKQFYVCVEGDDVFNVFKCLDNNGNAVSNSVPNVSSTSPNDEFYSTQDGYVWKFMYSVDGTQFEKFATNDYMPVIANSQVSGNAVSGAVDVITVDYRGSNYDCYLSNTFNSIDVRVNGDPVKYNIADDASANNNYYTGCYLYLTAGSGVGEGKKIVGYTVTGSSKTVTLESAFNTLPDATTTYEITPFVNIEGDGSNAIARALVNATSNSISSVQIISRGSGYTYATAEVTGNTGGSSNAAVLTVVKGPKGGHGSNPEFELGVRSLCISTTFSNTETNKIPVANDYRTIGILKDPLYTNVDLELSGATGNYQVGESVIQLTTNATGVVAAWTAGTLNLTNVYGVFTAGYLVEGQTTEYTGNVTSITINGMVKNFNTFDQRYRFTYDTVAGTLEEDEYVYQTIIQSGNTIVTGQGYVHEVAASNVYLTHITGVINTDDTIVGNTSAGEVTLNFKYEPDLVVGSGEVLYIENQNVITRSNTQSETIKIILQF